MSVGLNRTDFSYDITREFHSFLEYFQRCSRKLIYIYVNDNTGIDFE